MSSNACVTRDRASPGAAFAAAVLFTCTACLAQPTPPILQMGGKPATAEKASAAARLLVTAFPVEHVVRLALPAPAQQAPKQPLDAFEKRSTVGAARDLTHAWHGQSLNWITTAEGMQVARLEVTSATALAIRTALVVRALPAGSQLRVAGTGDARVVGPIAAETVLVATGAQGAFWTPVTEGESQAIEIAIPAGANREAVRVQPASAMHLDALPSLAFKSDAAVSAPCHTDVICAAEHSPAVARASRSVVKLLYSENSTAYVCTGTLVNNGTDQAQVPYVITAAHCIGSQAAASTLNTFWFFETAACGSTQPGNYRQLAGGATLLYTNAATDISLLRLAERAPAGAWFAGWDMTAPAQDAAVIGLHHPRGDVKKIASGKTQQPVENTLGIAYTSVGWMMGTTEPGSSGSGIFTAKGDEYLLRGALRGGPASCETSGFLDYASNRDFYSRLDADGPSLLRWLAAPVAPMEDYTDLWWDPYQPGWGLSIVQHASNNLFAAWLTHDARGQPTWFAIPSVSWSTVSVAEGAVVRALGAPYSALYDPAKVAVETVGSARLQFDSRDSLSFTVVMDGETRVRALRRQPF